jgi:hypothetical protein
MLSRQEAAPLSVSTPEIIHEDLRGEYLKIVDQIKVSREAMEEMKGKDAYYWKVLAALEGTGDN